jgi:hypothetical protein
MRETTTLLTMRAAHSPRARRVFLVLCPMSLLAGALSGARVTAQTGPRCTPDTSTVVKRLAVGMSADSGLDSTARDVSTRVAVQIATFFEPPTRLSIDKLRGPSEWKDAGGSYRSEGLLSIGQLTVDLGEAGRSPAVLDPGTGSPEVDHALLAAEAAADSAGFLSEAAGNAGGRVHHIRLWVLTAAGPSSTWAAPLFAVSARVPANATPATVQSESPPTLPPSLRAKRFQGDAYLAFEVDEQGHVPEASLRVLSVDDSALIEPAKQSIRDARFAAATQGGCPVSSTMRQRLRFRSPEGPVAAASEAAPADEGRWLAANLPRLGTGHVMVEVPARIGGTDIVSSQSRIVRAALDNCTLTIDRQYEADAVDAPMIRVRQVIPLAHADPRSLGVQQLPASGPSYAGLKTAPWRVVLTLRDGTIRNDFDRQGRRVTTNESTLDLIVSGQAQGVEVATHLQSAIQACQ